ncbi:hypothetical protein [Endozoicomonas sp.]|uniref:hypothetical protein n=1 Tax=Endozoicomonas sp. TaxID=1892382 RepID=UPI003AF45FDC
MADGTRPSVLTSPTFSNPVITPKSRGGTFADRKTVACPPRTSMLLPKPGYEHERRFESSGSKSRLLDRGSASTDSFDDLGVDMSFEPDGEGYDADKESQYESTLPRVRHDSGVSLDDDELLPLDPAKAQLFIEGAADLLDAREAGLSIEGGEQPEAISQKSFMNQLKTGLKKFFKMVMDFASKHKIAIGLALSLIFVAIMCTPAGPAIAAGAGLGILMSVGLISSSVFFGALLVDLMGGLGPDASRVPQPNSGQNQNQSSDKETSKTESADRANGGDSGGARSSDGTFHVEPQSASQSKPVSKGNPTANVGVQSSATSETQYEQPFSLERFETWVHEHIGKWAHKDMWGELLKNRSTRGEAGERVIDDPAHLEDFCEKFFEHDIELIDLVKSPLTDGAGASVQEQAELMRTTEEVVHAIIAKMRPTADFLSQMQLNLGAAAQDLGSYFTSDLTEDFLSLQKRPYYEGADRTAPAELRSSDLVRVVQRALKVESERLAAKKPTSEVSIDTRDLIKDTTRSAEVDTRDLMKETTRSTEVDTRDLVKETTRSTEVDTKDLVKQTTHEMETDTSGLLQTHAIEIQTEPFVPPADENPAPVALGDARKRRARVVRERNERKVKVSDNDWTMAEISKNPVTFKKLSNELMSCSKLLDSYWSNSDGSDRQMSTKHKVLIKELEEEIVLKMNDDKGTSVHPVDKSFMLVVVQEAALKVKERAEAIATKGGEDVDVSTPEKREKFIETILERDGGDKDLPSIDQAFIDTDARLYEPEITRRYIEKWLIDNWKL